MSIAQPPQSRILSRDALLERFARPRSAKIVFTNGVFDLLHAGHVEYLYAARALGDALVVGVNTDASVRRLKGPERPINAEADRLLVLAGLGCVDGVTLFDEDTPATLIAALVPDVLVKGADYRPDQVVGREVVEAGGGVVRTIPLRAGRSTSSMIQRIREAGEVG